MESWLPVLKARRLTLQIGADIWLPLSPIGGFEPVFCPKEVAARKESYTVGTNREAVGDGVCLMDHPYIDFTAYDSRLSRIQDGALKLEIALSRLLYPKGLTPTAEAACQQLVIRRFRPAMLQLVSGRWNRYNRIPDRAEQLLRLKKMDRFLKKELLKTAAEYGEAGFVRLLTRIFAEENEEQDDIIQTTAAGNVWKAASEELCDRAPGLAVFSDLMKKYDKAHVAVERISDKTVLCFARAYAHRLFHWMYMHPFQEKEISDGEQEKDTGYEESIWNLSCDIAVEYMVDRIFGPFDPALYQKNDPAGDAEDIESDRALEFVTVQTSEEQVYGNSQWNRESGTADIHRKELYGTDDTAAWKRQMILDQLYRRNPVMTGQYIRKQLMDWWLSMEEIEEMTVLFRQGDHDWWQADCGEKQTGFVTDTCRREARTLWEAALQKWADSGEGLKQLKRGQAGRRSAAPGHSEEEAKLTKRQGYDFHTYLKQFMVMREDRLLDLDSFDPVYYTYGLRNYQDMPFVEPLETKEVLRLEELVIVIDTSGSCSGRLVRFFLEETWSVFGQEENFFDHFHVRILQCDSVVQEDVKLTSLREAEQYMSSMMIKGGGGTDFREAFTYIRKLQEKGELMHLKGILYFTDGFGTFPASAPGCRTTFVFLKSRFGEVDVPVWADKLLLPLPEGTGWEPEYTGAFQANI